MSDVRSGGIHQALSGAHTVDVTGTRKSFEFRWRWLEEDEAVWLHALHTRHIPGPLRLVDPLRRNRLTARSASLVRGPRGAQVTDASTLWVPDWPAEAGPGARSLRVASWPQGGVGIVRLDRFCPVAVFPVETLTGSLWMRADADSTVTIVLDWCDSTGTHIGSAPAVTVQLSTQWRRFSTTATAPPPAAGAVLAVITDTKVIPLQLAAAQVETGPEATAWQLGGGAPTVLIDQLETTSPRHPLTHHTMTLLEA
ncbi:hypothetical protein D5S17_09430 [Pseudonocardiaceae bacterium YIM PH 21723]|nr:hypothetical protein D5S17_09430 [Pseudonocardiaceae bacterium YIM PH 21723]